MGWNNKFTEKASKIILRIRVRRKFEIIYIAIHENYLIYMRMYNTLC